MTRRRRSYLLPLALGAGLVLAGCADSGGAGSDAAPTRPEAAPSPSPNSDFRPAGGTSYQIGLPPQPIYVEDPVEDRENGKVIRTWRYDLGPDAPSCVVEVTEQPHWIGDFPQGLLLDFNTRGSGVGKKVLVNETVPPPPGAVGAVRQERTFTIKRKNGETPPGRAFGLQLFTSDRTLVSAIVGGPEDSIELCRSVDILDTLELTGTPPAA